MKKVFSAIGKTFFSRVLSLFIIVVILVALSVLLTVNIAKEKPEIFGLIKGPSILKKEEEDLVARVSSLIALPEGEYPTVATVSDKEQLQDQIFFDKTLEGDKLLIYTDARKVVLYRPSENRIVEVGTLNIQNQEAMNIQEAEEEKESMRFVILNGTQLVGLTRVMESELKEDFPEVEIKTRANANSGDYEETLLVDLAGNRGSAAEEIASVLGAKVSVLPEGESAPNEADFLIIVGNDRAPESPTP